MSKNFNWAPKFGSARFGNLPAILRSVATGSGEAYVRRPRDVKWGSGSRALTPAQQEVLDNDPEYKKARAALNEMYQAHYRSKKEHGHTRGLGFNAPQLTRAVTNAKVAALKKAGVYL